MMAVNIFFILFITVTNSCYGCKPLDYNLGSSDSREDLILGTLKNVTSIYNDSTVPNSRALLDLFRAGKDNKDVHLNFTQLVTKYEYPVEQHEVETDDGYLLTMFRIPNVGPPVILMHGLLDSSDGFIIAGPSNGLAYLLSRAGYDVWIGNNRGNKYSRRHVSLSPNCGEFWDFSFDEIGRYDLPAMIDYTLNATNSTELLYAGHSQGTSSFFVMCSEKPEYNKKISLMIALSAIVFWDQVRSPVFNLLGLFPQTEAGLAKVIGLYEFLPRDSFMDTLTDLFCGTPETAELICNNIIFLVYGFDYQQVNATNLPVIFGHVPDGSSTKQFISYGQLINSKKFRRYDYNLLGNLEKYGMSEPPDYQLERVTCAVAIFYALNDWHNSAVGTQRLLNALPNVVEFYQVPFPSFNHVDYVYAKNVKELVNYEVLHLFSRYTKY